MGDPNAPHFGISIPPNDEGSTCPRVNLRVLHVVVLKPPLNVENHMKQMIPT